MSCYVFRRPYDKDPTYKIGKANNPPQRLRNIATAYSEEIEELYYIRPIHSNYTSDELFAIEYAAHLYFADIRQKPNKEFFGFEDRNVIEEMKKFIEVFSQKVFPVRLTRDINDLQFVSDPDMEDYFGERKGSEKREKVAFDIKNIFTANKLADSMATLSINESKEKPITPHDYQLEILGKMADWYQNETAAGKLILPPGIGKSYITSFFIERQNIKKVLVLVPLKVIADDFTTALEKCGVNSVSTVSCETEGKFAADKQVYVAVINTARNLMSNSEEDVDIETESFRALKFDLIVYDEAHHMCAEGNKNLMRLLSPKKLYLTATEKIMELKNETKDADQDRIFDMNSPEFGELIFKMTIPEAISMGRLTDYKLFLARPDQLVYNAKTDNSTGIANLIDELKKDYSRKKIIIFANSVQNAEKITAKLKEKNYSAECVSEKTSRENRMKIVEKFQKDPFGIICNVATIGEGANIPCIDTVIFAEARHSNIGVIQNIGRGLRLYPNPKKEYCMVIIHQSMVNKNFLENLVINDERFENEPKKMLVAQKKTVLPTKEIEIAFLRLIEQITKNKIRTMKDFIKLVRAQGVTDQFSYNSKCQNFEWYVKCPQLIYGSFTWEHLSNKNKHEIKIYTSEQEIINVLDKYENNIEFRFQIQELDTVQEKINFIRSKDECFPDYEKIKESFKNILLHWIFKSV